MKTSASIFFKAALAAALCLALLGACSGKSTRKEVEMGVRNVSWYGPDFHGKITSSGEKYNMYAMTCAHKTLPFGTRLKLVSEETGKQITVTVNDRGPFVGDREVDLSFAAAQKLGLLGAGVAPMRIYVLDRDMRYSVYLKDGKVPSTASANAGSYTIQVASFSERDNAEYMKKGLDLNHREVHLMEKWIEGKRYYRVRVGKFDREPTAQDYARKLIDEGYREVRITPYDL